MQRKYPKTTSMTIRPEVDAIIKKIKKEQGITTYGGAVQFGLVEYERISNEPAKKQ